MFDNGSAKGIRGQTGFGQRKRRTRKFREAGRSLKGKSIGDGEVTVGTRP